MLFGFSFSYLNQHCMMKLSSRDVTFCNVLWRQVLLQQKGWDWERLVVHPKGADNMAVSGLSLRKDLDWLWVGHFCPPMHKQGVLSPCTASIPDREAFFHSLDKHLLAKSRDYCKLINGWVWFESQTCRGWLQEHLCEVWRLKTLQNWGYGACIG